MCSRHGNAASQIFAPRQGWSKRKLRGPWWPISFSNQSFVASYHSVWIRRQHHHPTHIRNLFCGSKMETIETYSFLKWTTVCTVPRVQQLVATCMKAGAGSAQALQFVARESRGPLSSSRTAAAEIKAMIRRTAGTPHWAAPD